MKAHGEKQWVELGRETGIYILKSGSSDFQSNTKSENGTLLVHTKRPSETRLMILKVTRGTKSGEGFIVIILDLSYKQAHQK